MGRNRKKFERIKNHIREHIPEEQMKILEILDAPRRFSFPLAYGDTELPGYPVFGGADMYGSFEMRAEAHRQGYLSIGDSLIAALYTDDPAMDTRKFDVADWQVEIQRTSKWMDAYGADLSSFVKKNGKIFLVQGTMDPQVTAQGTV